MILYKDFTTAESLIRFANNKTNKVKIISITDSGARGIKDRPFCLFYSNI